MNRYIIIFLGSFIALIALFAYQSGTTNDAKLHVVFCDVGQGDAIYIRTAGEVDILVDSGRGNEVLACLTKYMPLSDKKIELAFATHPDADHIGGFTYVLKNYKVESFSSVSAEKDTKVFEELQKLIEEYNIEYKTLSSGDRFSLSDGVKIETLWPDKNFESSDTNDYSLVQLLSFGEFDLLLTGDIPFQIINEINFDSSSIDIFKLPHHGSKTGADSATFDKIKAELAIISAGRNNSYHHPHPSVLNLLNQYNVSYLRTDEKGTIEIVTDGRNTRIVN